ncbi:MAG: hypothetical protein D6748_10975 [Calditrichaeota bacterium]|nr:MAG: hypothetical protein D6748_10975 [Calditrichota bacterium]
MKFVITIIFLSVLAICLPVKGQQSVQFPVKIDSVIIVGNEKTKDEVILREIPFTFPDSLTLEDLQVIQNRISNLLLFNRVELKLIPAGERNYLMVEVTEMWYIYPVPIFFLNDKEWDRISYGFQLTHLNFRGMNELLSIGGWLGYNPAFFLTYQNPWVGKKKRYILGVRLFTKLVANRFFDFDERHLYGNVTLGKRFDLHRSIMTTFSLRRIVLPPEFQQYSVSGNGTDLIPKITLTYKLDYRDLIEYPRSGYYFEWIISRSGFTKNQPRFWRFDLDNRAYFKLTPTLSIGGRNLTRLNKGELPIYDRIFIGYMNRIRGYFDTRMTAKNLMLNSVELRWSILPIRYLSVKSDNFFRHFLHNLKYGISLGAFIDSGIAWDSAPQLNLKNHNTGYGLGIHIHLPFIYLIRIERAWNDQGRGEWIIDSWVTF